MKYVTKSAASLLLAAGLVVGLNGAVSLAMAPRQPVPRAPGTATPIPKEATPAPTPAPASTTPEPTTPSTPAKPAAPGAATPGTTKGGVPPTAPVTANKEEPEVGPYLKLSQPKDMILTVRVRILRGNSEQQISDPLNGTSTTVTKTEPLDPMKSIAMIWPMLPRSGSSNTAIDGITGRMIFDDAVITSEFKPIKNYQGGVQYARFDAPPADQDYAPKKVELLVNVPVTVSRTEFDEKAAMAVGWPKGWPAKVGSWLQPQLYIESGFDKDNRIAPYKDEAIIAALKIAGDNAGVADFKKVSPVAAAKIITNYVWGAVQVVTSNSNKSMSSGEVPPFRLSHDSAFSSSDFGGVIIQPPESTLSSGRGTEYDSAVLLTAMLKKAGLPAHPVIGYDAGGSGNSSLRNDLSAKSRRDGRGMRCWVEFALFDEANNTLNWIPIDIGKLNKTSSRPLAVDKPWRYFGSNDEFNNVIPFAFHFFPPTDVVSYGAPAFWGWFVTPKAPQNAGQALMFTSAAASKRGGADATSQAPPTDDQKKQDDKKKEDKKKEDDKKKKRGY